MQQKKRSATFFPGSFKAVRLQSAMLILFLVQGPGVELMPGCTAVLENNRIQNYSDEMEGDEARNLTGKGGVHLHVSLLFWIFFSK